MKHKPLTTFLLGKLFRVSGAVQQVLAVQPPARKKKLKGPPRAPPPPPPALEAPEDEEEEFDYEDEILQSQLMQLS